MTVLLSGRSHLELAQSLSAALGLPLGKVSMADFPDGEIELELHENVRGQDVFVVQSLHAPVGNNLLELSLLADACLRHHPRSLTAVVPYLGYARQDRRERSREPLGARVIAELLTSSRIGCLICLDLHSRAVEGCFAQPVEHTSCVPLLVERLRDVPQPAVVVSPDLGAVKRAEAYARALGLPVAVVHKQRLSGAEVAARGVVGEVRGKFPIVVDDMISTGATLAAAIQAVLEAGAQPQVTVAATHGLFVGDAPKRLAALPLRKVICSNSVPAPSSPPFPLELVDAGPVLAEVVRRLLTE